MREDPLTAVRTSLHEQAHHCQVAPNHGVMESAVLVVLGRVHGDQFRPACQHGSDLINVARLYRVDEARDRGPIDKSFELRPTGKAVSASDDSLRITQPEGGTGRVVLELTHFRDGGVYPRPVIPQQVFCLLAKLFQAWLLGQAAPGSERGTCSGHDDLLSITARCPRFRAKRRFAYK